MVELNIVVDGDGQFPEMLGKKVHQTEAITITGLARGTAGGKPSVALIAALPDGSYVFAQTTLALLLTAAEALKAAHGDPRE